MDFETGLLISKTYLRKGFTFGLDRELSFLVSMKKVLAKGVPSKDKLQLFFLKFISYMI